MRAYNIQYKYVINVQCVSSGIYWLYYIKKISPRWTFIRELFVIINYKTLHSNISKSNCNKSRKSFVVCLRTRSNSIIFLDITRLRSEYFIVMFILPIGNYSTWKKEVKKSMKRKNRQKKNIPRYKKNPPPIWTGRVKSVWLGNTVIF